MPILYKEASGEFHLYNKKISYIIKIMENGQMGQVYYGKRLRDRESYGHLLEYGIRSHAAYLSEEKIHFSPEHVRQEYPLFGTGDVRYPACEIEREDGSTVTEFKYKSHRIYAGKPALTGLPAVYTEADEEAATLEITLFDELLNSRIILLYTIFEEYPVIARSTRVICGHPQGITLKAAMSGCLDLPDKEYQMIDLAGAWARERHVRVRELDYGIQSVYSMRGCSSHQFNPFLALKRRNADERCGEVIGFSLVYSGDFLAQAEVDNYNVTRVLMGIHPDHFAWELQNGEEFQTPELVMAYSADGIGGMSRAFQKLYRTRLARGEWRDKERPILINNWEATYFKFDEEKILTIAEKAKELGVELFVLDDGWFGRRDSDRSSLGDWYPNLRKLPDGITGLAEKVTAMDMGFGLWFEPEMVNPDSDLYRNHPDWVLADPRRQISPSRHQYVLDFSKKEVVDYIHGMMRKILKEAPVTYVKWDMNRSFSEVFSGGKDKAYQGMVRHRYILGVYDLYERLIQEFPHILFESCASGGARFDPGMLYYAPQAWTSDDTDAMERLKIQYGTSFVYPISSMGSHVSASPNHQVFRKTPMQTRADVAYFGTFGYELDVTCNDEAEQEEMRSQIAFMKRHRKLIQQGDFYRLRSPFEGNDAAWMVVSEDKKEALAGYYRILQPVEAGFDRIRLEGLLEDAEYEIDGLDYTSFGDELMQYGLSVSDESCGIPGASAGIQGDFMSRLFYLKAK